MAQKICFVISKGFEKSGGATRAFQFAALTVEAGHQVEVFLIDDAIHWAQLGMAEGHPFLHGRAHEGSAGHPRGPKDPHHVCKACADKRLISPGRPDRGRPDFRGPGPGEHDRGSQLQSDHLLEPVRERWG